MKTKTPLKFKFDTNRQKLLLARGIDRSCFSHSREAFTVEDSFLRMKPKVDKMLIRKAITVKTQLTVLSNLMDHPLRGSPIIGIGSFPSDMRAKMLAANIMDRAITFQTTRDRRNPSHYPLWHRVYGGFGDPLLDNQQSMSMLIISNVGLDSTAPKIEKVRDLLTKYDNIPRIVITHGCDPMEFFLTKMHMPMTYGFYLGADSKSVMLDI